MGLMMNESEGKKFLLRSREVRLLVTLNICVNLLKHKTCVLKAVSLILVLSNIYGAIYKIYVFEVMYLRYYHQELGQQNCNR